MKKLILLVIAFILLGVLVVVYLPITPNEPTPQVGADKDVHGCIASAGYTYSVVRGGCIRVWEAGVSLFPVGAEAQGPTLAAYAVQSENGSQVEVFLPGFEQGVLLSRDANVDLPMWQGQGWTLTYDPDQGWKLSQYGELLYASKAQ